MIWVLPLEPLEERYTSQWYRWVSGWLTDHGCDYVMVPGEALTARINHGEVLDAASTSNWKAAQLQFMAQRFEHGAVHSGDTVFVFDLWFPGLESIPYMAHLCGVRDLKIYAFAHAGSYASGDFTEPMAKWARPFELGWLSLCSAVFTGSEQHTQTLRNLWPPTNVKTTGCLFNSAELRNGITVVPAAERSRTVIWPHRTSPDKDPQTAIRVLNRLYDAEPDFRLIYATPRMEFDRDFVRALRCPVDVHTSLSKSAYHSLLAEARIIFSTSPREYFGYCVAEGAALGCAVVASYTHRELLGVGFPVFRSVPEAVRMLSDALSGASLRVVPEARIREWNGALDRIMTVVTGRI